jgi:type VI secretion system protein VasG
VTALIAERDAYETKREALAQRWEEERSLVQEIIRLRAALFAAGEEDPPSCAASWRNSSRR